MSSGVRISSPTAAVEQPSVSAGLLGSGRILTALVAPFLLLDGITKVMKVSAVLAKSVRLGFSENLVATGVTLHLSTIVEAIPRSYSAPVAIWAEVSGIQMRVGHPRFSQTLFPVYLGVLVWLGLYFPQSSLARAGSFAKLI